MDSLTPDILLELECPVCTEYMQPPITLCENGHNTCNNCKPKLTCCPTCKGKFLNIRSITVENIARELPFPCKYRFYGCKEALLLGSMLSHQEDCSYMPFKCPFHVTNFSICSWEDSLAEMKEHIICNHTLPRAVRETTGKYVEKLTHFGMAEELNVWYQAVITLGEVFMWFNEIKDKFLWSCVMYVGPKHKASKFKYRLSVSTANGDGSASICQVTEVYQTDIKSIFQSGKCAVFQTAFAMTCLDDEGELPIEVEIFSCEPWARRGC